MEDSPPLYISEFGDSEDIEEEEEEEDIYQEEALMEADTPNSRPSNLHKHSARDTDRACDFFPCQHCKRQFTSRQGLERHMHIHTSANNEAHTFKSNMSGMSPGSDLGQPQHENTKPSDSVGSVTQRHTSSPTSSNASVSLAGEHNAQADKQGILQEHHACKFCEKRFTSHASKRQHERRIHKQHLQQPQPPQDENPPRIFGAASQQEAEPSEDAAPASAVENEGERAEQYMLDVSSNISENLSFYIDGKIVSTSTVSGREAAEAHSGSSTLIGLDALILDPAHISQVLNADPATGKELPGQPVAKRRTATPPLLPQIKTELESEVVVSSSSSSLVSSLIENLLPQNTESTFVQKNRTVFLSPKLKQLLEKQDGLKPTLALIADSQKPCSPISLSVLPAVTGRFKRRTGSPHQNSSTHEEAMADPEDCDVVCLGEMESQRSSPVHETPKEKDNASQFAEEPAAVSASAESWPPITGGNSCNQQPLDLSNTVKRNEDEAFSDAALDLSLQKRSPDESELTTNLLLQAVLQAERKSNTRAVEELNAGEQNLLLGNPQTPLVTDFTIVTGSNMVDPVTEGLVYGLALPSSSLTPAPGSITPVALPPATPCTIAFASPASHAVLPAAPSLITVLAPSAAPLSNHASQPIQVLAPNLSAEPLVICTENALNPSECNLTTAFTTANSANLVTLSHPLDPTMNLPGHVFLTDQIALNPPLVESTTVSEVPFTPAVTLNDSLINSYNITSNTVLIECTIALETPGSVVPAAISLQESPADHPAPTQMLLNHIEQQQIVSLPNPGQGTVEPTVLMSSIAESVTMSTTTTSVLSDCLTASESTDDPEPVVKPEPPILKEENPGDESTAKASEKPQPSPEKMEEKKSLQDTPGDTQTFTKNFICNVCDKLFHSMKELGQHVGDHADEWPYKCEFCVLLFDKPSALLDHRSSLHGVGKTYVCSACTKDFVYLCNLKQHQEELHPGQQCSYTEEEKGKLRPQNYNNSTKVATECFVADTADRAKKQVKKEENEVDMATEELFTTIKIMASDGGKLKGPDVRLGINQHYPSFKPPPFPYHNRSPAGSLASATNFTTHNIPQTFSTAIRCTKCGKSFDNMPELHKHILACANASDKRRYTPKKNPIPLRHFAKSQNGVLSTTNSANEFNASNRASHSNRSKANEVSSVKVKFKMLNKRKKKLVQRVLPQRNKSVSSNKVSPSQAQEVFVCPHCRREFTMRRSRTKHMAVCPKKPKEGKKRKEVGISVTKENNGRLHRGVSRVEEKQASPLHKTRLQTSGPAKRPSILPVQTVFSSKRSKIIIKESSQPKKETPALNELPVVRSFNPSMRQYSRIQHGVKGIPIKITIVKPQKTDPQKGEPAPAPSRDEGARAVAGSSEESAAT